MTSLLTLMLLGPVSSASPKGPGTIFSGLFIIIGTWVLVRTWNDYLKRRRSTNIPMGNLLWVSGLATFFIVAGIWGVLH
jgi:hypothetical protein